VKHRTSQYLNNWIEQDSDSGSDLIAGHCRFAQSNSKARSLKEPCRQPGFIWVRMGESWWFDGSVRWRLQARRTFQK
jgi:hypothetical protein